MSTHMPLPRPREIVKASILMTFATVALMLPVMVIGFTARLFMKTVGHR